MSSEIVIKFLVAAVLAGTPFLFGTVGEILSEKVGHLNLGVEGMMSIGALRPGFMVGYRRINFVAAAVSCGGGWNAVGIDLRCFDCHIYGKSERNGIDPDDFRRRISQFYRRLYAGKIRERHPETSGCGDGTDA